MRNLIVPTMSARVFRCKNPGRAILALVLMASASTAALAQYGGPGATPSYGSKGAVVGGVVAGAAAGAGLLYWKLHHRATLQGCVAGSGDKLVNDKDKKTYSLTNQQNETLKPGERFELLGKKAKTDLGELMFEVHKMNKDLGQCTASAMEQGQ